MALISRTQLARQSTQSWTVRLSPPAQRKVMATGFVLGTMMALYLSTATCRHRPCSWALASGYPQASRSLQSVAKASPPARICTLRSGRMAPPPPTRSHSMRETESTSEFLELFHRQAANEHEPDLACGTKVDGDG